MAYRSIDNEMGSSYHAIFGWTIPNRDGKVRFSPVLQWILENPELDHWFGPLIMSNLGLDRWFGPKRSGSGS